MNNQLTKAAENVISAAQRIVREHQDNVERSDISWRGAFSCSCDLCCYVKEYNRLKKNS